MQLPFAYILGGLDPQHGLTDGIVAYHFLYRWIRV